MVKKAAKKVASKGRAPIKPSAAKKAAMRPKRDKPGNTPSTRRVRPDKQSAAAEQAAANKKALKARDEQQAKRRDTGDEVDAHNEQESDTMTSASEALENAAEVAEDTADSDIDEETANAVDDVLGDSDDDMDDDGSDLD